LFESLIKLNIQIYAYCILSNHYHILIKGEHWKENSKFIQLINGGSSYQLNKFEHIERRSIWATRWAKKVNKQNDFEIILGYILGNPIKHGLTQDIKSLFAYQFCNYRESIKEMGIEYIDNLILKTIALNPNFEEQEKIL
jgi:REP element-mobilizing transposase RayT